MIVAFQPPGAAVQFYGSVFRSWFSRSARVPVTGLPSERVRLTGIVFEPVPPVGAVVPPVGVVVPPCSAAAIWFNCPASVVGSPLPDWVASPHRRLLGTCCAVIFSTSG